MKRINFYFLLSIVLLFVSQEKLYAQPPCQNGPDGIIYIQSGGIQNYDPSLPISATNPTLNTIPNGGGGLAVANNLNGPGPSPTFYTIDSGNYFFWDGTAWVNTGHSAGATINMGGGGNFIYNLNGGTGDVWQYDGTGPATLLVTVPGFSGGGPYDLVGDCDGGFYILRTNTGGVGAFLRKYNSAGVLVQSWTPVGTSGSAGGGFAIIGNTVYSNNSGGFLSGQITSAPTINFTPVGAAIPNPSDMACCPVCEAGRDTVYYCQNEPFVTLSTIKPPTISWSVDSGSAVITGSGSNVQVTATTNAIITASSTNSTSQDSFFVIPVKTNLNAGADYTIAGCGTYTDTLNAIMIDTTAGINYTIDWQPAANILNGGNTLTPGITQTGITTYTITVTSDPDQGGCTWIDSITVDVDDFTPQVSFIGDVGLGCENDTIAFTNTSVTNPNGNPTYFWLFGNGGFSSQQNPTEIYGVQGVYNVTLTITDNGCVASSTQSFDLNHPIEAEFAISNNGPGASTDSICLGNTFIFSPITVPLSFTNGLIIDWDLGDGTIISNAGGLPINHTYLNQGAYNVKLVITDSLGCQDSITKLVYVDQPSYVEMSATPIDICVGETVYFTDSVSPNTTRFSYNFGDGNIIVDKTNPSHNYATAGMFNVIFKGEYAVCDDDSITVTIQVNDYPLINLGEDLSFCPGINEAVTLQDVNNPSSILTWSTGEVASSITVSNTGYYAASASNGNCASIDSVWVKRDCYLSIPNSFTPSGDGLNDYFIPRQLLSSGLTEFSMKIFNRWGELIFTTNNIDGRGWDGRYGGKEQPLGVYVYLIEAKWRNGFKNTFQGNVTLLR